MRAPPRITADVRQLCRKLGDVEEPVFVDVVPRIDSRLRNCIEDARRQVSEFGGSVQHGWLIWQWPGICVEGEFHALWRKPNGELLDVSVKEDGEKRVLFVPDRSREFKGERVRTIRHAIERDPRIKRFIEVSDRFERLLTGRCRGRFGEELVLDAEMTELQREKYALAAQLLSSREARRAAKM